MRLISRFVNVRGELFSSTFTFGLSAVLKLGSSLVLTRLLNPAVYGIVAIMFTIVFAVELLSDVGSASLLIRHHRGSERVFIHTVWTVRLIRSSINFTAVYLLAPFIAHVYGTPALADALHVYSFWFLLQGLESMAFIIAQREQRSRISNYVDLITNLITTGFVIALAYLLRNEYAFIYGMLIQRLLATVVSHFWYRDVGVGFAFDKEAVSDQFKFARVVLPSSLLTMGLSQYDKIVLLKLFDFALLGVYGLAGNVIGPASSLIMRNCRVVLYPRCAEYFRTDRARARERYYGENKKLLAIGALAPAAIAGFSESIITILYDSRYAGASYALMTIGLGVILYAAQNASESLMVASGMTRVGLFGNVMRIATIVPATLSGYYFFGFHGFLWFSLASSLVVSYYYYWEQYRNQLLDVREEITRFAAAGLLFLLCLAASNLLLHFLPPAFHHYKFK